MSKYVFLTQLLGFFLLLSSCHSSRTIVVTSVPTVTGTESLLQQADTYYFDDRFDEALNIYNQVLIVESNSVAAYTGRGNVFRLTDKLNEAFDEYSKALAIDPAYAPAYRGRGLLFIYNYKELTKGLADFNEAIRLDPDYALAYYSRGSYYYDQGNLAAALADYNKAIDLGQPNSWVYYNRAILYKKQDNLEAALADFNKAIELNPQNADAYVFRANVYAALKNLDEAVANFSKAIELDPQNALAYYNRGLTYKAKGNKQAAKNDFEISGKLNPDFAENAQTQINSLISVAITYRIKNPGFLAPTYSGIAYTAPTFDTHWYEGADEYYEYTEYRKSGELVSILVLGSSPQPWGIDCFILADGEVIMDKSHSPIHWLTLNNVKYIDAKTGELKEYAYLYCEAYVP